MQIEATGAIVTGGASGLGAATARTLANAGAKVAILDFDLDRAKSETAALQIDQIGNAVQLFYIDVGRYPSEAEGLAVLFSAPPGDSDWRGPYLPSNEALTDPWGRPYLYSEPGESGALSIKSLGRDGTRGGSGEDADLAF